MKSEDKLLVFIEPMTFGNVTKPWVRVVHKTTGFQYVPSFEDIGRQLREIAKLEDETYPPALGFQGRQMVLDYMTAAIMGNKAFEELNREYQIPQRE